MQIQIIKDTGPGCIYHPGSIIRISDKRARQLISMGIAVALEDFNSGSDIPTIINYPVNYPIVGEPITSVIIPVHNQVTYLKRCLDSVEKHTTDYEIILIDNGSDAETREVIKNCSHKLIRNVKNLGFPHACNQGILHARGQRICLLNSDTIVTAGWLDSMVPLLQGSTGLIGPTTNYSIGSQMDRRILSSSGFSNTTSGHPPDFTEQQIDTIAERCRKQNKKTSKALTLGGFCLLIDRRVISQIGGFDKVFGLGCGEEIDFEQRALSLGWEMTWARDAYVHHFGHATINALTGNDPMQFDNRTLMAEITDKRSTGVLPMVVPLTCSRPIRYTTWNRLEYTKQSLPALLETTDTDILIYDDSSDDGTQEYLDSIDDSRILARVYNKTRQSIDNQMDLFFSVTAGTEWVGFVDNDTVLPPGWFEKLIQVAQNNNLLVVGADHQMGAVEARRIYFHKKLPAGDGCFIYPFKHVGGSGVVIKRSYINSNLEKGIKVRRDIDKVGLDGLTYFYRQIPRGEIAFYDGVFADQLDMEADGIRTLDYEDYNRQLHEERMKNRTA